tara:strand:- start:312 stop:920 length:609 start_codon:yes stop_codon:yes gene_type:complete
MSHPRTLLDFAGVAAPAASMPNAALVIIDPQREYLDGALPLEGIDEAIVETSHLLRMARESGAPIIHVLHHAAVGSRLFNPEGPYAEFIPELAPCSSETILIKGLPNAFAGTELASHLRETGHANFILVGFATHMCVSATARAAVDLGLRSTIVARATATRDLPAAGDMGTVPASEIKRATLAALADRFSRIVAGHGDLSGG